MKRLQGSYALIQFSAVPERMEFLNVGVMLVVPELQYFGVRFASAHSRLDRFFRQTHSAYLDKLKAGFKSRLMAEFQRRPSVAALEEFASKRANELRISPFLPVAVVAADAGLEDLFRDLVGENAPVRRRPTMGKRLRDAFIGAKIIELVEAKPPVVEIPESGIEVRAPFGYQNGAYNLIDGLNLEGDRGEALKEAGKRAFEGALLWKHGKMTGSPKRLVVVADFGDHPGAFYDAVGERLDDANVQLYRFDNLRPLVEDIEHNAKLHPPRVGAY